MLGRLHGLLGGRLLGRLRRRRDNRATVWAVGALGVVFKLKTAGRAFNLNHAPFASLGLIKLSVIEFKNNLKIRRKKI